MDRPLSYVCNEMEGQFSEIMMAAGGRIVGFLIDERALHSERRFEAMNQHHYYPDYRAKCSVKIACISVTRSAIGPRCDKTSHWFLPGCSSNILHDRLFSTSSRPQHAASLSHEDRTHTLRLAILHATSINTIPAALSASQHPQVKSLNHRVLKSARHHITRHASLSPFSSQPRCG